MYYEPTWYKEAAAKNPDDLVAGPYSFPVDQPLHAVVVSWEPLAALASTFNPPPECSSTSVLKAEFADVFFDHLPGYSAYLVVSDAAGLARLKGALSDIGLDPF